MDSQKVKENLETAKTNTDVDRQYMAARDMTEILQSYLQKGQIDRDSEILAEKILDCLIWQLVSHSKDIQGNAIRCLTTLIQFITPQQIQYIAPQLLKGILGQVDLRDNFQVCLQELVEKVKPNFELNIIKQLVQETIKLRGELISLRQKNQINIQQDIHKTSSLLCELLRLISIISTRWKIDNNLFDQMDFSKMLFDLLLTNEDKSLRKQSINCLGALGYSMNITQLNQLFSQIYFPNLKKYSQYYSNPDYNKNLILTQLINIVSKSSSLKLSIENKLLLVQLISEIIQSRDSIDIDYSSQLSEILELNILTLDILYSREHKIFENNGKNFIEYANDLLQFDPFGSADIGDIEEETDEYLGEADDSSWRVRKSGAILLQTILTCSPNLYNHIADHCFIDQENSNIFKRLKERKDEVQIALLNLIGTFIQKSVVIGEQLNDQMEIEDMPGLLRKRSSSKKLDIHQLIQLVIQTLESLLQDSHSSQRVKSETIKVLNKLFLYFKNEIQENVENFQSSFKLISIILKGSQKNYTNEQKIYALKNLRILYKFQQKQLKLDHVLQTLQITSDIIVDHLGQEFIRVVAETLRLIKTFVSFLSYLEPQQIIYLSGNLMKIRQYLLSNIQLDNLDFEVKIEILQTLAKFITFISPVIGNQNMYRDDLNLLYGVIRTRLQQDQMIFEVLHVVNELGNMAQFVSEDYLIEIAKSALFSVQKQDKSLRLISLKVLNNLLFLIPNIPQTIIFEIILKSKTQFEGQEYYLVEQVVMLLNQLLKTQKQKVLASQTELNNIINDTINYVATMSHSLPSEFCEFFYNFGQVQAIKYEDVFKKLVKYKRRDEMLVCGYAVAHCIRGQYSNNLQDQVLQLQDKIKQTLQTHKTDTQQLQLLLSTLRVVSRYVDHDDKNFQLIEQLIETKNENELASLVYGSMCVANQDKNLKRIYEKINKANLNMVYNYFTSLREFLEVIIALQTVALQCDQVNQIFNYLIKHVQEKDKNSQRVVAEILGKLATNSLQIIITSLQEGFQNNSEEVRFVCATASKHCFYQESQQKQLWQQLIDGLFELLGKEKNIDILTSVIKGLTTAFYSKSEELRIDPDRFFKTLSLKCLNRFEKRELDFGNFKETRDDAKELRSLSLDLFDIAIEYFKITHKQFVPDRLVEYMITNFTEDKYEETRGPRLKILIKLIQEYPVAVSLHVDKIVQLLEPAINDFSIIIQKNQREIDQQAKNKSLQGAQQIQVLSEKDQEKLKLLLKTAFHLRETDQNQKIILDFLQRINLNKNFQKFIIDIQ